MEVAINENITKTKPWVTIKMSSKEEIDLFRKFEGEKCYEELERFLIKEHKSIKDCRVLNFYRKNKDLSIVAFFKSIEVLSIRGGKHELKFNKLKDLVNLERIHINEQSKSTGLQGIEECKSLKELYIGDFTFGKPITIESTNSLVKSNRLRKLFFSNTKIEFEELKKLILMKNLEHLSLNQKYEFEEFAELSVLLPHVESNELKPWQYCMTEKDDVKINGKRKPYLDKNKHRAKIKEYEKEFLELQMKYAK